MLRAAAMEDDRPFRELLAHFQHSAFMPSLRHRADDLPSIVEKVLAKPRRGRNVKVSPAWIRAIARYQWPENVRHLEEALASALSKRPVGERESTDLLGYCCIARGHVLTALESIERDAIVKALQDAGGNRVQAAASLDIARITASQVSA